MMVEREKGKRIGTEQERGRGKGPRKCTLTRGNEDSRRRKEWRRHIFILLRGWAIERKIPDLTHQLRGMLFDSPLVLRPDETK